MIDNLCKAVIAQLRSTCFVETGTHIAETVAEVSIWFAELYPKFGTISHLVQYGLKGPNPWNMHIAYPVFSPMPASDTPFDMPRVYSLDSFLPFVMNGRTIFSSNPNVRFVHGSSEKALARMVETGEVKADNNPFFYLDAHWNDYWPLRDELSVVLSLDRAIVVIDDFEVPDHPEWGYDIYKGEPCGISVIKDLLLASPPISVFFPLRSNRDNRGYIVICKGFSDEELSFFSTLPFSRFALR